MNLHSIANYESIEFATTDYQDFLNKCETLYNDVSNEDWEDFNNQEEIIEILKNHSYIYQEINADRLMKIENNNDLVNLYFKLQRFNPTINFDNGTELLLACNRLLNYYYNETIKYINDTKNEVSLLEEIVGGNGIEQLKFHTQFRDTYNVYIY